jgi:hypothetical protein
MSKILSKNDKEPTPGPGSYSKLLLPGNVTPSNRYQIYTILTMLKTSFLKKTCLIAIPKAERFQERVEPGREFNSEL